MEYIYDTENTCAAQIKVEINGDVITGVEFRGGGCNGNLKAIPRLVEGKTVDEIVELGRDHLRTPSYLLCRSAYQSVSCREGGCRSRLIRGMCEEGMMDGCVNGNTRC